ncbi:signal transduction histidine kinase [Microbacterium testaceum]|nr:signal transduction histidine kinase [Microbacterium sp. SORGH_AS_0969]MDQ1117211.1 signal transduction histidine kinase [Microbacterium testaceum]
MGGSRHRRGSRSRGFSGTRLRRSLLTGLILGLTVFLGLWLTVTPEDLAARWTQLALGATAVAGVMAGSRLPFLGVVVTTAATACAWTLHVTADPFMLTGFAVFRLAEKRGGRRFPWWMFAGVVLVVLTSAFLGTEGVEDRFRGMVLSAVVLCVAWVLGVRTREVREEAAARSRAEERLRVARDVHDVLSHSLGTIGVQAGVAAHVSTLGTEQLREVLRGIEGDARASLFQLKALLQRERTGTEAENVASSPLSTALARLAMSAERAGICVRVDSDETIDGLPSDVRTTVLRVVQEAMTNVIRHAAASLAIVRLHVSSESVTVGIQDDGQGAPRTFQPGHGLAGMRERIELLGGTVDFASSTSGFTVSATIPLVGTPSRPQGRM